MKPALDTYFTPYETIVDPYICTLWRPDLRLHSWIWVYFQRAGGDMAPVHSWIWVYFRRAGGTMPPPHCHVRIAGCGRQQAAPTLMDLGVFSACGRQHAGSPFMGLGVFSACGRQHAAPTFMGLGVFWACGRRYAAPPLSRSHCRARAAAGRLSIHGFGCILGVRAAACRPPIVTIALRGAGGDMAPVHSWICAYFGRAGGSMAPLHCDQSYQSSH